MKKKSIAALLAFFFGMFGTHRFYLGQRFRGIIYIAGFIISFIATIEEDIPFVLFFGLLALLDGILLAVMPKEEFDYKYNNELWQRQMGTDFTRPATFKTPKRTNRTTASQEHRLLKKDAIVAYKDFAYEEAIEYFQEALRIKFEDQSVHFNMACCYSMIEDTHSALFHLDKAIDFGFDNYEKIQTHEGLSFLRTTPEFIDFVDNNYQYEPLDQLNLNETEVVKDSTGNLIEEIKQLGQLLDKGVITHEEFQMQKQKMMKF